MQRSCLTVWVCFLYSWSLISLPLFNEIFATLVDAHSMSGTKQHSLGLLHAGQGGRTSKAAFLASAGTVPVWPRESTVCPNWHFLGHVQVHLPLEVCFLWLDHDIPRF